MNTSTDRVENENENESRAGFTPGPWHEGAGNGEGYIWGPEGQRRDAWGVRPVAHINGRGGADRANARLIAAAPEMFDALRAELSFLDWLADGNNDWLPENEFVGMMNRRDNICALLQKIRNS